MKILYILQTFQHPLIRGNNRHYEFIRHLSASHDITLLALSEFDIPAAVIEEMQGYTRHMELFGIGDPQTVKPRSGIRRLDVERQLWAATKEMKEVFYRLVREETFDLVLFQGKGVYSVIADFDELPLVIDFCDATSLRIRTRMSYVGMAKRALLLARYLQVRWIEHQMVNKTPYLAFASTRDRDLILETDMQLPTEIVSNGIDLAYWRLRNGHSRNNQLIFTGVMNYGPNEDAALYLIDTIMPRLWSDYPELELMIVGSEPTEKLRARASNQQSVTVTGHVEDMRPYLEQATLFVAPIRYASGQQNKIQEALAVGVPIVTTPLVADGVRFSGDELPLHTAEGSQDFAKKIVALLRDPEERARLSSDGRFYVEKHFDWPQTIGRLERLCRRARQGSK